MGWRHLLFIVLALAFAQGLEATTIVPEPAFMKCVGEESVQILSSTARPLAQADAKRRATAIMTKCEPKLTTMATADYRNGFIADLAWRMRYQSKVRLNAQN